MTRVRKAGMIIHPVDDLDAAVAFYTEALGLELRFRDGERFAALAAGDVTVALAAAEERVHDTPLVSYQVDDVHEAAAELVAAGATLLRPPEDGPHERRAVLRDPAGNGLVVYQPLA